MNRNSKTLIYIEPKITGLHGCRCHPFTSWEECKFYHNQRLKVGQPVKNRCNGDIGNVNSNEDQKGYVTVKYGARPCDIHLEHVAMLQLLPSGEQLRLFN